MTSNTHTSRAGILRSLLGVAFLMIAAACLITVAGCSNVEAREAGSDTIEVHGTVLDAAWYAVPHARVRLATEVDTIEVVTDSAGRFKAWIRGGSKVSARVRATGYRDAWKRIEVTPGAKLDVTFTIQTPYPFGEMTTFASREPSREAAFETRRPAHV